MSCYPMQFPAMVAENKTVSCALKFKVTTKGIWNASEDKLPAANVMVKPPVPVNLGKRGSDISLDAQRWKKHKVDLSKDKSCRGTDRQRDRVSVGVSKPPEENIPVKSSMLVNSSKRRPGASFDDHRWMKQSLDSNLKLECMKILKGLMNHSYGWAFCEPVDPVKLKIPDYFEIIKNPMDLGTIKHKLEGNMYSAAKEFADDVKLTFENAMLYNPSSDQVHRWAEILDDYFLRRWKLLDAKLKHTNKNDDVTRQVPENNHQVMKPVGLMKAPVPEKLGNSRRISLEERQKSTRPCLMQAKPGKTALTGCSLLSKTAKKEHCTRRSSSSANLGQSIDFKLDCEVKRSSTSLANSIALDSDVRGVGLNEENPCSTSATTPASIEGWISNVQMSPKKALRVAMLKSRFADTIFKATHPTLVDHDEKSDPSRIQQERLRLEKEQLKEKARIEAQIKAAEEASRRKEQDWKMQREIERKAARMALEKIEKTVEIDRTPSMLKDINILFGGYPNTKSLEKIGLCLKEKYMEEDETEEGEIL